MWVLSLAYKDSGCLLPLSAESLQNHLEHIFAHTEMRSRFYRSDAKNLRLLTSEGPCALSADRNGGRSI